MSYKKASKGSFSCGAWLEDSSGAQIGTVTDQHDQTYCAIRVTNRYPQPCKVDSFEAQSVNNQLEFKEHTTANGSVWEERPFCTLPAAGPWGKTEFSGKNSVRKRNSQATGTEYVSIRVGFAYFTMDSLSFTNQVGL